MQKHILMKDKLELGKTIKVTAFRKEIRKTIPHKHNSYVEIIFLSKGSGFHSIDSQKYEVKSPTTFFVRKEQMHHWELDSVPDGYVIIIKKQFVESSLDKEIKALLYNLSKSAVLHLKETDTINYLFQLLTKENLIEATTSNLVVEGLLKALLAKLLQEGIPISTPGKRANFYSSFRELLSQEGNLKNNVAYYAEQLNTSPQNLNAACRKAGSVSAANVLSEFIISEAKRLLIYTDNTIAEIAIILHFNDSSRFIKYFKSFTNFTPQAFRIERF